MYNVHTVKTVQIYHIYPKQRSARLSWVFIIPTRSELTKIVDHLLEVEKAKTFLLIPFKIKIFLLL